MAFDAPPTPAWLVLVRPDGVVLEVHGGAPVDWTARKLDAIHEIRAARPEIAEELRREPSGLARRLVFPLRHENEVVLLEILELEALPLHRAHVRVTDLIMRTLDAFVAQAQSSSVDLQVEQEGELPAALFVDGEKIAWVLATLVGNALRYASGASDRIARVRVLLRWDAEVGELVTTVRDNGPGIPEHRARWLFDRNPATGASAGLALLMVRDVVVAHGGSIDVASVPGRGTDVVFRIPKPTATS